MPYVPTPLLFPAASGAVIVSAEMLGLCRTLDALRAQDGALLAAGIPDRDAPTRNAYDEAFARMCDAEEAWMRAAGTNRAGDRSAIVRLAWQLHRRGIVPAGTAILWRCGLDGLRSDPDFLSLRYDGERWIAAEAPDLAAFRAVLWHNRSDHLPAVAAYPDGTILARWWGEWLPVDAGEAAASFPPGTPLGRDDGLSHRAYHYMLGAATGQRGEAARKAALADARRADALAREATAA